MVQKHTGESWIQFAVECGHLDCKTAAKLYKEYDEILAMLVTMGRDSHKWVLTKK